MLLFLPASLIGHILTSYWRLHYDWGNVPDVIKNLVGVKVCVVTWPDSVMIRRSCGERDWWIVNTICHVSNYTDSWSVFVAEGYRLKSSERTHTRNTQSIDEVCSLYALWLWRWKTADYREPQMELTLRHFHFYYKGVKKKSIGSLPRDPNTITNTHRYFKWWTVIFTRQQHIVTHELTSSNALVDEHDWL